MIYIMDKVN